MVTVVKLRTALFRALRLSDDGATATRVDWYAEDSGSLQLLASSAAVAPGDALRVITHHREPHTPGIARYPLFAFGRAHVLVVHPSAILLTPEPSVIAQAALTGLLLTACIGVIVGLLVGRRANLETQVLARTKELASAKRRLEAYIASAPDGVVVTDERGRVVEANPALCAITGYTHEELLKVTAADLLAPSARDRAVIGGRALATTGRYEETCRCLRKDGTQGWWIVNAVALSRTRFLGFVKDVTEERRLQVQVETTKEQLERLVASAQDGIIMADEHGCVTLWSRSAERMFGIAARDAMGRLAHDLLCPPETQGPAKAAFERFTGTGEGPGIGTVQQLISTRGNGEPFPVELVISPVRVGDVWHAVGVVRDVSERQRAEAAVREYAERLEFTTANVPGMIFQFRQRTDGTVHFPYASQAMRTIYGCSPEDCVESADVFLATIHPDDLADVLRSIGESAKDLAPWRSSIASSDRTPTSAGWRRKPPRNAWTTAASSGSGTPRDITNRRKMEQQLIASNRELEAATAHANEMAQQARRADVAKSEFLANMSHEIPHADERRHRHDGPAARHRR